MVMTSAPRLYEGRQKLTTNWSVALPFPMAMRIEEESLVFWHSPERLTLWLTVAQGVPGAGGRIALDELKENVPGGAFDVIEERDGNLLRYAYRLDDGSYGAKLPALYGFAVAGHGEHVVFAGYFDHAELFDAALSAWSSIEWAGS